MFEWEIYTEHFTRIRIAKQTSFDRSRFNFESRWAFLLIYVTIAPGIERSQVSDGGFWIMGGLVCGDWIESSVRKSIFQITGPDVGFSLE